MRDISPPTGLDGEPAAGRAPMGHGQQGQVRMKRVFVIGLMAFFVALAGVALAAWLTGGESHMDFVYEGFN